jgi:hypothetical protein
MISTHWQVSNTNDWKLKYSHLLTGQQMSYTYKKVLWINVTQNLIMENWIGYKKLPCSIWASHGTDYKDYSLLDCIALYFGHSPTFWRNISFWTRCYNPEYHILQVIMDSDLPQLQLGLMKHKCNTNFITTIIILFSIWAIETCCLYFKTETFCHFIIFSNFFFLSVDVLESLCFKCYQWSLCQHFFNTVLYINSCYLWNM